MTSRIFSKDFPNNLKIARRRTNGEQLVIEIQKMLNELNKSENNQNPYLKSILEKSTLIGNEK